MSTNGKTPIEPIEPELEPEYVGAYRYPLREGCAGVSGDYVEDLEYCDAEATHTIVMRSVNGHLNEIAMCDDCGEPEDARRE